MLLVILLHHHLPRTNLLCEMDIDREAMNMEDEIGVTRANRVHKMRNLEGLYSSSMTVVEAKATIPQVVENISNALTQLHILVSISESAYDYAGFWKQGSMVFSKPNFCLPAALNLQGSLKNHYSL